MVRSIAIVGNGPMRGLDLDGSPLMDGKTGKPVVWPKAVVLGAMFGADNEVRWVLGALMDEGELKCVN